LSTAEHNEVIQKLGNLEASNKVYERESNGDLKRDAGGNAMYTPEAAQLRRELNQHVQAVAAKQAAEAAAQRGATPNEGSGRAADAPPGAGKWQSGVEAARGPTPEGNAGRTGEAQHVDIGKDGGHAASGIGRQGELGPNGTDRPSLGNHADGPQPRVESSAAYIAESKLSDAEHQDARAKSNELASSGKAWDADGKPTPEFKAVDDKLRANNDAVSARIDELRANGVNWDNPTTEFADLQRTQSQYVNDRANQYLQWTVQREAAFARGGDSS
jgi:hypothetical protein